MPETAVDGGIRDDCFFFFIYHSFILHILPEYFAQAVLHLASYFNYKVRNNNGMLYIGACHISYLYIQRSQKNHLPS